MQRLNDYLYQLTLLLKSTPSDNYSARSISQALQLNRSTISSYLNEGVREGLFIKVKSYPVLFLHRTALEELHITLNNSEIESIESLLTISQKPALDQVIGSKGSLKEAIDQIKTAVLYPGKGLPLLLIGASGSGKTFLANKIYEYAVEEKVIHTSAPFIDYNCAQYVSNPELLSSALFGYTKGAFTGASQEHTGLLEKADGGVLFLDEVHRLSEEGQEKLFTFMDTGEFSPMGDNSIRKKADVRLVFATTENIYTTFLPTFLRRLPVIVNLPRFQQRPSFERLSLIDEFFVSESKILAKELSVSDALIHFLMNSDFEGNVGNIKNIIKYACGNAYIHQKSQQTIQVKLLDMPLEYSYKFKEQLNKPRKKRADRIYYPEETRQVQLERNNQLFVQFFDQLLTGFSEVIENNKDIKLFLEEMVTKVTQVMDTLIFQEDYEKEQSLYAILNYHIRQSIDFMRESYGFEQDGNRVVALANYLYVKDNQVIFENSLQEKKTKDQLNEFFANVLETPYWYAKKILSLLSECLDQPVYEEDIFFITLYFYSLNVTNVKTGIKSIVLAHGYSTASSMANVANRMLNKNVFQAYDMPLDITLEKIEAKLIQFLGDYRTDSGLILLVDMGSLNQLGGLLVNHLNGPLLIIDHINTPLLLEVGQQVLNNKSITEIGAEIETSLTFKKQLLLPKKKKKKAIITCCYTGIGSATQIQEILTKCLKDAVRELVIIPYDYKKLLENKNFETPFQSYDVIMIVGTEDPKINQIPYIGLDRLINGEAIGEFVHYLEKELTIEVNDLQKELIFNFSISKIVENLTILDPDKVLSFVQKAIKELSKLLNFDFSNNQLFLLYLHCSCMIERIVRKESVDEQEDIEEYMQANGEIMDKIHSAFFEIEREYTIEIPDLELRLLSDIVQG
ncbi:TPA: sigma 54-interacting transcriptional regulator [Enterococcus faecium]|nr:sigma 54-interacting transcriptional regulator [Enterococcus faecium]